MKIRQILILLGLALDGSVCAQRCYGAVYVVCAFPAAKREAQVQTAVYTVNGASNTVRLVQLISDPAGGVDAVSVNYGARVLVVTSPAVAPTKAYVLSMDTPESSVVLDIGASQELSVLSQHLIKPSNEATFAIAMADDENPYLLGVNLLELGGNSPMFQAIPWASFSTVQVLGSTGVSDVWSDAVQVRVGAGGTLSPVVGLAHIDTLDFVAPADLTAQNGSLVFLNGNNEYVAVLSSSSRVVPNPTGLGSRTDYVYNKNTHAWKHVTVPGSVSWGRVSGPWLLYVLAEPSKTQVSPGKQILSSGVYFPGKLLIYDSRSDQSYTLETGQGDTEPLVVDGETLYYRVNNSIYTATIGTGAIQSPTRVAMDDRLSEAHWAFVGQ